MSTMQPTRVHITKLAAAERQLRAAIRMYFAGEDELAIHTVVSAAYRLLTDLKAERGEEEAADVHLAMIFYAIRDYRRGALPEEMKANPELMAWVREMAERLPIEKDSKIEDIALVLPREAVGDFWNKRNKIANFLKHADRDPRSSISLNDVDNMLLLMQCYTAYIDLTRNHLGNEGLVFQLFIGVNGKTQSPAVSQRDELVQRLAEISEEDRRRLCSAFISELNSI